jgi:hypothetical protein
MTPNSHTSESGYVAIPRELLDRWRTAVRERDRRADERRLLDWLRTRGTVPAARR